MSTGKCGECGTHFQWDPEVGSGVCIDCGNLQDPSQCVLTSHLDPADKGEGEVRHWVPQTTLKSIRSTNGWNLAGQGKEVTFARNKNTMHQYISALATRLGHPGLAPRAQVLFDQAMLKGAFRWGRKARLVAGACLAVALREAHKGATMQDIAFLLSETPVSVARVFTVVLNLLGIQLTSGDPTWHLPILQTWLKDILAEQPCPLPHSLVKTLKSLHIPTVLRTGSALSELIARTDLLTHLPSPPTACALFILACEGESLTSLPNCGKLAETLGKRFGVSKDVVMRRYKVIYDQVEKWLGDVPWLDDREGSARKKGAKVAKRVLVARGLKDVVQFQDDIWKAKFEALGRPEAHLELDEDDGQVRTSKTTSSSQVGLKRRQDSLLEFHEKTKKRRTGQGKQLDAISQFLLSPLDSLSPTHCSRGTNILPVSVGASYLLTSDRHSFDRAPTRLQLLASTKHEADITDEELFTEGELQGFLRSTEEAAILARTCDWAQEEMHTEESHVSHAQVRDRTLGGTTRVNMEALNRLLADTETDSEWAESEYKDDDDEWAAEVAGDLQMAEDQEQYGVLKVRKTQDLKSRAIVPADNTNAEEIEPWRPLSPAHPSWGDDSEGFDFALDDG